MGVLNVTDGGRERTYRQPPGWLSDVLAVRIALCKKEVHMTLLCPCFFPVVLLMPMWRWAANGQTQQNAT